MWGFSRGKEWVRSVIGIYQGREFMECEVVDQGICLLHVLRTEIQNWATPGLWGEEITQAGSNLKKGRTGREGGPDFVWKHSLPTVFLQWELVLPVSVFAVQQIPALRGSRTSMIWVWLGYSQLSHLCQLGLDGFKWPHVHIWWLGSCWFRWWG